MHGTNPIAKSRIAHEGFRIHSIFPTLQGEGPFVGYPAIFLRLSDCNLKCFWCDTEFESGYEASGEALIESLRKYVDTFKSHLIVITGGEPMLQPLHVLIDSPIFADCMFQIETSGSYWPIGGVTEDIAHSQVTIVCSPKTPNIVSQLRSNEIYDVYWKYIVRLDEPGDVRDGLPTYSTQHKGRSSHLFRPIMPTYADKLRVFVQGCDEGDVPQTSKNVEYAKELALRYGYRLSLQTHKILGLA